MLYTYTAVITRGTDKCYARVPDIPGCATTGKMLKMRLSKSLMLYAGVSWSWNQEGFL